MGISTEKVIEREQLLNEFDKVARSQMFTVGWTEKDVIDWLFTYEFEPVETLNLGWIKLAMVDFEKNEDYEVCALIKSIVDDNLTRTQAFEKYGKEK